MNNSSAVVEGLLMDVAQAASQGSKKQLQQKELETLCDMFAFKPALAKNLYPCRGLSMKDTTSSEATVVSAMTASTVHQSSAGAPNRVYPLYLLLMAKGIDKTLIKTVEEANPDAIKHPLQDGNLALHFAILHGVRSDIMEYLIYIHPEAVEHRNETGQLPLHLMIITASKKENKTSSNRGRISSSSAELGQQVDALQQLIEAFPDAIATEDYAGWTPLTQALCHRCSFQMLRHILANYPLSSITLMYGRADPAFGHPTAGDGKGSGSTEDCQQTVGTIATAAATCLGGGTGGAGEEDENNALFSALTEPFIPAVKKITPAASTLLAMHMENIVSFECFLENWSRQALLSFFQVMEGNESSLAKLVFVYSTSHMRDREVRTGFCTMLKRLRQLRSLEVIGSSIENHDDHDFFLNHLAEAIMKHGRVEELSLTNFFIHDTRFFVDVLKGSSTLSSVSLERVALTDMGTASLVHGIEHSRNPALQEFSFQDSYPSPNRTEDLAMALRSHR